MHNAVGISSLTEFTRLGGSQIIAVDLKPVVKKLSECSVSIKASTDWLKASTTMWNTNFFNLTHGLVYMHIRNAAWSQQ